MDNSPGRREAKRFEPPPWEQDQFEELQRRRAEDDAARAAEPEPEPEPVPETVAAEPGGPEEERPPTDEKAATRMLAELSAEEPRPHRELWRVGLAFSASVIVLGAVLMIWGIVGLMRTINAGPTGVMAGWIMIIMGVSFISMGAWTAYRSLQQRGVL